jgi:hypothetical protein
MVLPLQPACFSYNQERFGPFDFNKMPLAPLGTKALAYNNLATRAFWAQHATDGFYVCPAPAHCQVPVASEQDKTLLEVANIFNQLG